MMGFSRSQRSTSTRRLAALGSSISMIAALTVVAVAPPAQASTFDCLTFSAATAGTYTCEVPAGVTSLAYVVQGAAGANSIYGPRGGRGALIKGTLAVTPGETLYLVVGRYGASGVDAGGGGGYSAIARGGFSKDDTPLVIAGGGGGGTSSLNNAPGGASNPALTNGGGKAGYRTGLVNDTAGESGGTGATGGAGGEVVPGPDSSLSTVGGAGGDYRARGVTPPSTGLNFRGGSGGNGWGYATETQRGGTSGNPAGGGGGSGYAGGGGGTSRTSMFATFQGGGGGGSSLVPDSGVTSKSIAPTTYGRVVLGTAPEITAISPNAGPIAGGTSVTITGTSFISGATVTIGGTACTQVAVVSSTQITCTTPAKAGGTYDVVVTNPTGFAGTFAGGYSYFTCSPTTYVDAPYTYVAFDDIGDCTWAAPVGVTSADYVVVAGGGGGGSGIGGGGGAGGMLDDTIAISDDSTSRLLTITVGAGGAGSSSGAAEGTSGEASSLASGGVTVTAAGGGGGGSTDDSGLAGGSGGGAGGSLTADGDSRKGGAGSTGGAGGNSDDTTTCGTPGYCPGGGGGGAGSIGGIGGGVGDDTTAGAGGVGRSVAWLTDTVSRNLQVGDDSGGVPFFAGGGGGGVDDSTTAPCAGACGVPGIGGAGGGGAGSKVDGATAASGIPTTGGGGGGAPTTGTGGSGGSGVVVLRFESTVLPDCVADSTGTNGSFTVLTFTSAGQCAFARPPGVSAISYLLIGGGGGGGGGDVNGGGGGGGGSIRDDSVQRSLGDDTVLIFSIGAGGLAGQTAGANGRNGLASSIEIGSTTYTAPGGQGGTGGGTTPAAGGAGGTGGDETSPGGGGGAGAASADDSAGTVGSAGPTSDATGATLNYGGGGGGGAHPTGTEERGPADGGAGGGGDGAFGTNATSNAGAPGVNGLGGGGGGGQGGGPTGGAGGNGGSGGLIIEYLTPTQVSLSISTGSGDDTYGFAFTPQPQISIDDSAGNRVVDDSGTIVTATILDGIGNVLQEDTAIAQSGLATFDGLGLDDSVFAGEPTITFTAVGLTSVDETVIINQFPPQPAAWPTLAVVSGGSQEITPPDVQGVYAYAAGGLPGTWSYTSTDPAIASVSGDRVIGGPVGTTTIIGVFTPTDAQNYLTTTAELTVQVTPGPVFPPGPPRDVIAVPGDGSATISWQPPTNGGSFPITDYRVVAQPGGAFCLVSAPATSCTIEGLTNGVAYTFAVEALNGAGWGASSPPSNEVTPSPSPTPPVPDPVPVPPLEPGESELEVDGTPRPVEVDANSDRDGLDVTADGWTMTLNGLGPDGRPLDLDSNGVLIVDAERDVRTTGTNFRAGTLVTLFLDPPALTIGSRSDAGIGGMIETVDGESSDAETVVLGSIRVAADGTFAGSRTLPDGIAPGPHVIQAVGFGPAGEERALSIGIIVRPWIELFPGTRSNAGRLDRIRTGGDSGGIDAGQRIAPFIRYDGQDGFTRGKARIRIKEDGTFTWTRLIRKNRGLTAYVSWRETDSNEVYWRGVRSGPVRGVIRLSP